MDTQERSFLHSCSNGEIDVIRKLIDEGVNIDAKDENGNTAVHKCCEKNNVRVLELMLKNGAHWEAINDDGNTCLHVSVLNMSLDCVKLLLNKGMVPDSLNKNGETELVCAVRIKGNFVGETQVVPCKEEILKTLLIERNTHPPFSEVDFRTVLHLRDHFAFKEMIEINHSWSTKYSSQWLINKEIIKQIVSYNYAEFLGSLVNGDKKFIETAEVNQLFFTAIDYRRNGILKCLVDNNIDCNIPNEYGVTCLHSALSKYSACCAKYNEKCQNWRFVDYSSTENIFRDKLVGFDKQCVYLAMAVFLIENGNANICALDKDGNTPLAWVHDATIVVKLIAKCSGKQIPALNSLNYKFREIEKYCEKIEKENESLIQSNEQLNKKFKENNKLLKDNMEQSRGSNDNLRISYDQVKQSNDDLMQNIEQIRGSNEQLKKSNDELKKSNEQFKESFKLLRENNEEIRGSNDQIQKSYDQLKQSNDQLKENIEQIQERCDQMVSLMQQLKNNVESKVNDLSQCFENTESDHCSFNEHDRKFCSCGNESSYLLLCGHHFCEDCYEHNGSKCDVCSKTD